MVRFAELLQSELPSPLAEKDAENTKKATEFNSSISRSLAKKELNKAELLTCKIKLATVLYVCQIKSYFFLDCMFLYFCHTCNP